jgi:hypothetical protein
VVVEKENVFAHVLLVGLLAALLVVLVVVLLVLVSALHSHKCDVVVSMELALLVVVSLVSLLSPLR